MENPVNFELRLAAHVNQVARINAEDWKHQAGPAAPGRLRTTLARTLITLAARLAPRPEQPSPAVRPASEATAAPAL
jgi:hypothetical protein